jgi:NAD(P)-dependent dehydrogenase (short-subunit alcohol dehydrogenase family)
VDINGASALVTGGASGIGAASARQLAARAARVVVADLQADRGAELAESIGGTFDCIRLAATAMGRTEPTASGERGAIVSMASVAAFDGQIGQAAYSSSKGGIVGMTLPVARDLSAVGIRVNTIAPGLIDTPIYGEGEGSEAFKAKLGESVLFPHRLGDPEELASMVVELVTNSYMNAEVVRVDGGIRMPPK